MGVRSRKGIQMVEGFHRVVTDVALLCLLDRSHTFIAIIVGVRHTRGVRHRERDGTKSENARNKKESCFLYGARTIRMSGVGEPIVDGRGGFSVSHDTSGRGACQGDLSRCRAPTMTGLQQDV